MNILFVRNYPSVDGVFTLLLRLARHFKDDGHRVYFIDFGVKSDLDFDITQTFNLLNIGDIKLKKNIPHIDIIFPFVDGDLLCWCINFLKHRLFKSAKIVFGVYHPRAYFGSTLIGQTPDSRLHKYIFTHIPSQNVLFMNEVVKREHTTYFDHKFQNSPIVPIPVLIDDRKRDLKTINRKKIVSIGRLETFKWYVIPMIDTLEGLNKAGYSFEFYIYGYGELEFFLKNYIIQKKVDKYIFLMGKLDYQEIYSVLEDAFMFVGMGTTIIETSAMGVPSLQAIDSEKRNLTYGFFNKLKGFCLGEISPELPLIKMKDAIVELITKSQMEYEQICNEHIIRANTFNIDVVIEDYYIFFSNASIDIKFRVSKAIHIATKLMRQVFKLRSLRWPNFRSYNNI